jgi:hypothetical protein
VYAVVEWFDFKHEMSWYEESVSFSSYLTRFFGMEEALHRIEKRLDAIEERGQRS